jgi:hypothetical protein
VKPTDGYVEVKMITDLYCEGIRDPIPYPGRPAQFEGDREGAMRSSGTRGMAAMVLRWRMESGEEVVLDLNRTRVVAMIQRRVSP